MMKIKHHRTFRKQYRKLPVRLQKKVNNTLLLFQKDPHNRDLYNHPLKGDLKGRRAITVIHDLRIIFEIEGKYEKVTLLSVGSHDAVY